MLTGSKSAPPSQNPCRSGKPVTCAVKKSAIYFIPRRFSRYRLDYIPHLHEFFSGFQELPGFPERDVTSPTAVFNCAISECKPDHDSALRAEAMRVFANGTIEAQLERKSTSPDIVRNGPSNRLDIEKRGQSVARAVSVSENQQFKAYTKTQRTSCFL